MKPPRVLNMTTDTIPPGALYIGRQMPASATRSALVGSVWANHHKIISDRERLKALDLYLADLRGTMGVQTTPAHPTPLLCRLHELADRDLVCWCRPKLCHGHVLAALVAALPAGDPVALVKAEFQAGTVGDEMAALDAFCQTSFCSDLVKDWKGVAQVDAIRYLVRNVQAPDAPEEPGRNELF